MDINENVVLFGRYLTANARQLLRYLPQRTRLTVSVVLVFTFLRVFSIITLTTLTLQTPVSVYSNDSQQDTTVSSATAVVYNAKHVLRSRKSEHIFAEGITACPRKRRPLEADVKLRNGRWQYTAEGGEVEVVVFSAFFDDRPILGVTTWLRILGVAMLNPNAQKHLACYVWYGDFEAPYVIPVKLERTGRSSGYVFNRSRYVQYLFSCQLPGIIPFPEYVSLVASKCGHSSIYLPVERPVRSGHDHEFGACVAVAFGSIPVDMFVEWMELNRLLGITEFNVYDADMQNMSKVFDYYTKAGLLHVHQIPPAVDVTSHDAVKLGSAVSLNDCLLKNMYRYRYAVIIDFDEFIIPKVHDNYSDMIASIDKLEKLAEPHHTYTFKNVYFFRNLAADANQPRYLRTASYRNRVITEKAWAPKSFVDPRRCLSVFNHFCYISLAKDSPVYVNSSIAASHHYRMCGFEEKVCKDMYTTAEVDDTALRFKDRLQPQVEEVLKYLNVTV